MSRDFVLERRALTTVIDWLPTTRQKNSSEVKLLQRLVGDTTSYESRQGKHWAEKHETALNFRVELRGIAGYDATRNEILKKFNLTPTKLAVKLSKGGGKFSFTDENEHIITISRKPR